MNEDDNDRVAKSRQVTGEMAMTLMDMTGPDYFRRIDQFQDSLTELAVFMREEGCEPKVVAAGISGLMGAFIVNLP